MTQTEPTPVPLVDLVAQYHRYRGELDAAIREVLETGAFIGGPALKTFEADFAAWCGAPHAVGVGNGTDALYLILRALGVGPGDEVIVPANTFIATAEAAGLTGATPVFVDVDEASQLVDPAAVEAAITERTRAVMAVHLFGQLAPMARLAAICEARGLHLIEDSAQAHGARLGDRRAGALGVAAGFSFYPGKNLGAYGDGGAVTTADAELADRIRRLANHGRADKFGHEVEGVNSRLDGLQAAILGAKLRHLDTATAERQAAARRYDALLEGVPGVRRPTVLDPDGHVFHLYVIRVPDRDGLLAHLKADGIGAGIHYPQPLHLLGAYAHLGQTEGSLPVAERLAREILSLPMFPELTEAQQRRVVDSVRRFQERTA